MTLNWLPPNKRAAVCFTIDDIHPGKSTDVYEAGGDLDRGALGYIRWLLDRHPQLHVTLFTTADWREISPVPTRKVLARIPYLREKIYLTKILPIGTMRLSKHPEFVHYLNTLPRTELALHGLHHIHTGLRVPVEFQNDQSVEQCKTMLEEMMAIFDEAGLRYARGMNPPGWDVPENLAQAMVECGLIFVSSARDIRTPISAGAVTNMSGLKNVSLIYPQLIQNGNLIHFTSNFQATTPIERAIEIIECGGLLAIKGHIVKSAFGHVALDGIDALYCNYLDLLFNQLTQRYGESLWWTTMGEIAEHLMKQKQ
ncbi:MAG: DUF2334 domain-containing protein [Chloroflexi bacterium]|nr:DUF2334 domain-containing protein [Chloroflexota bacterium]MBI5712958.1 DUF2334 domain-containing protein [Chloroflexota bacterium]